MSLQESLKNKRVLVTGAGKGIGRALCIRLHEYGATVFALSRTEETLSSLQAECPNVKTICVDLLDWEGTRKAVEEVGAVDAVINNAAVGGMQPFLDITPDIFDEIIGTNLKAVVNVSQVTARAMVAAGNGGSIVNITSMAGQRTLANYSVFCASKAGLDMLSKNMAVELGKHKIRVNTVTLGCVWTPAFEKFVDLYGGKDNLDLILAKVTDRTPLGDPMIPMDDVCNTVLFVLSDLPSRMTGENVVIDGGYCAT